MADRARRIFVAGSTGATGQVLVPMGRALGLDLVAHRRPKAGRTEAEAGVAIVELGDRDGLVQAMAGATTIVQLIGTMRKRFAQGDTYETSDIGTTRQLVEAGKAAGVDHVVLLSSLGAGKPVGAYLKAKAEAERIVRESGIDWTIVRPSAFDGGGHKPPPGMGAITKLFGMDRYRPITLEQLARAILKTAKERGPIGVALEGKPLWEVVGEGW